MERIATLHVVREHPGRQLVVMSRMLTDRRRLRHVDGLEFARVLGTGRGEGTGPSADLRRQAYFLVWRDAAAARRFLGGHPLPRRWETASVERCLALGLVSGHGTWSGRPVLDGLRPGPPDGEIVALTRARIRPRAWRAFRRASRDVSFVGAAGLCWTLGIGELPVGLLGTVSCWRSEHDLDTALRAHVVHATAASHAPDWFADALFARFRPIDLSTPIDQPASRERT